MTQDNDRDDAKGVPNVKEGHNRLSLMQRLLDQSRELMRDPRDDGNTQD